MSDWLRTIDVYSIFSLAAITLAWAAGGWLLGRSLFSLRPVERLGAGLATGLVLFIMGVNLFTRLLGTGGASWLSAGLVLLGGLAAAWRSHTRPQELGLELKQHGLQLVALALLSLLFETAQRGVSIFDEYLHLPLVSIMGGGDIPPHFYLDPSKGFAYHYGLQVYSATLENPGGFFPWTAWDTSRGLAIGLTLLLGWLWVRRWTGNGLAASLGGLLLVFGGGTRWLLLLLPGSVLAWASRGISMTFTGLTTGSSLAAALVSPWQIEGAGAMPFPFAYHNGTFVPVFFNLGSTGAMPFFSILLLLLLARPAPDVRRPAGLLVLSLVFASLALSAEHIFAFWWGAALVMLLAAGWAGRRRGWKPSREIVGGWAWVLGLSAILAAVQGGFITETLAGLLTRLGGAAPADGTSNLYGFALRWPPAIIDAHLGYLSPLDLRQLLVLLLELGPVLLLAPLATRWAWNAMRRGEFWSAGLGLAALLSVIFTLFVQYGLDRSSTRFAASALWIWLALGFPALAFFYRRFRRFWKSAAAVGYAAVLLGGVVIFAIQLTSVPAPRQAYYLDSIDQAFASRYWNALPPGAEVLDNFAERGVTVFGRATRANADIYVPLPEWKALIADPLPQKAAASGYAYVYMSSDWWKELPAAVQQAYAQPCVRLVTEVQVPGGTFRRLLDIRGCAQ